MQVITTVKSLLSGLSETSESDSNPSRLLRDRNSPQKASPDSILALQILLEVLQVRRGHRVQVLSLVPLPASVGGRVRETKFLISGAFQTIVL